jgi:cysteinyl-tRNA synthetase
LVRGDGAVHPRRWLVLDADFVLGLDLGRPVAPTASAEDAIPAEVAALAERRATARAARDFATADELRARIADAGYDVTDGPDGQGLRRR